MLDAAAFHQSQVMQAVRKSAMERLQPLSQADASSACTSWLGQLAKDVQKHCPASMAACASPAQFASLEEHLQSAISHWQPAKQPLPLGTLHFNFTVS